MKRRDIFRRFAGLVGAAAVAPLAVQFATGGVVKAPASEIIGRGFPLEVEDSDFGEVRAIASADGLTVIDFETGRMTIIEADQMIFG